MSRRELSWYEQAFLKTARVFGGWLMGYNINFDEELLRQHGISGLIRYGRASQAAFEKIIEKLGLEEAHLVAAFASFFNGCDYCSWGHLFALNLIYLERTGKLYPIDEAEVLELIRKGDSAVFEELERRLGEHPEHLRLLKRQQELRTQEGGPVSEEDKILVSSITLFEWVNECSIVVNAPAPPMDPIAKKKALLARYEVLRAPLRAEREKQKAVQAVAPATP